MVTILPPISNRCHNFKCGEIYCETETDFNVVCSFCTRSVIMEDFVQHFRVEHLTTLIENTINLEDTTNVEDLGITRRDTVTKESTFAYILTTDPIDVPIKQEPKKATEVKIEDMKCEEDSDDNKTILELINEKRKKKKKALKITKSIDDKKCKSRTSDTQDKDIIKDHTTNEVDVNEDSSSDDLGRDTLKNDNETDNIPNEDEQEQFTCFKCDRTYKNKYGLRKHEYRVHSAEKIPRKYKTSSMEHKCEKCDKICRSARELQIHISRHDGIKCDECGKQFTWAGSLVQHKKRHSGIKEYKCSDCPKEFFTNQELKNHSVSHNGLLTHICEICGKKCLNGAVLRSHMRRHTGERPEKCNICGKAYYDRHDLNAHMVTHTNDRPFKCDICNSTYQTRKALGIHKWIHNKERKYACRICSKKFAQPGGLKSHIRKAHNAAIDCLSSTTTSTPILDKSEDVTNRITLSSDSLLVTF